MRLGAGHWRPDGVRDVAAGGYPPRRTEQHSRASAGEQGLSEALGARAFRPPMELVPAPDAIPESTLGAFPDAPSRRAAARLANRSPVDDSRPRGRRRRA